MRHLSAGVLENAVRPICLQGENRNRVRNTLCASKCAEYREAAHREKGRHRIEPPTQGTIKWYNSIKGYGFIVQQDLPIDIFMHKSSITEGLENASEGNPATYQLEKDASGRLVAIEVRITKKR
jgi:CspA family cold shock protein